MQRVRSSALTQVAPRLVFRDDKPFSGLVYVVADDGLIAELRRVFEGVVVDVSDDWFDVPNGGLRVDAVHLEMDDDYGPQLYRGTPITGIVYFFDREGACVVEEEYASGHPTEARRRAWYPSGALREDLRGEEGASWFEDGRLQTKGSGNKLLLNLVTGREGRLEAIVLRDRNVLDVGTLQHLVFSDELSLIGQAIDTELLRTLHDQTELRSVPRLRLINTNIGPEGIDVLVSLDRLTKLTLVDNPRLRAEHAQVIRDRRPDCTVHYEVRARATSDE